MNYKTEKHNVEPMSKEVFLHFFDEECENVGIYEVIDQDIFISSMASLLYRTLKNMGHYNLPEIDKFNHKKYIEKLLENVDKMSADDFKSKFLKKENSRLHKKNEKLSKQNEQLKKQSNQYFLAGTKEAAICFVGRASLSALDFAISKMSEKWSKEKKTPHFGQSMYSGFSFADIAKKTVVDPYVGMNLKMHDSCSKEVRKFVGIPSRKSILEFGDNMHALLKNTEDVVAVANMLPLPMRGLSGPLAVLSDAMSAIVIAADTGASALYSWKMTANNMKMAVNSSKIAFNNIVKSVEGASDYLAESLGLKENFIELLKRHFSALENDKMTLCKMIRFSVKQIKR